MQVRTVGLEDAEDLVSYEQKYVSFETLLAQNGFSTDPSPNSSYSHTSNNLDLGNAVAITEDNTDLRWGGTLPGHLADVVDNLLRSGLHPSGRSARVRDGRGRNALALAVKTTHTDGVGGAGEERKLADEMCRCRELRKVAKIEGVFLTKSKVRPMCDHVDMCR